MTDNAGNSFQRHLRTVTVAGEYRLAGSHAGLGVAPFAEITQGSFSQFHQSGLVGQECWTDLGESMTRYRPFAVDLLMTGAALLSRRKFGLLKQFFVNFFPR